MTQTATANQAAAQSDAERDAYNLAFCELGLDWFWDTDTFSELQREPAADRRVHSYIARHRPHLLRAYDAGFLAQAIETTRALARTHAAS